MWTTTVYSLSHVVDHPMSSDLKKAEKRLRELCFVSLESSFVFDAVLWCLLPCPLSPWEVFDLLSFYRSRYRNTELFSVRYIYIYIYIERYIEGFRAISNTNLGQVQYSLCQPYIWYTRYILCYVEYAPEGGLCDYYTCRYSLLLPRRDLLTEWKEAWAAQPSSERKVSRWSSLWLTP